jgi:hypothetical protein
MILRALAISWSPLNRLISHIPQSPPRVQHPVSQQRLMRAVKGAKAKMNNARAQWRRSY